MDQSWLARTSREKSLRRWGKITSQSSPWTRPTRWLQIRPSDSSSTCPKLGDETRYNIVAWWADNRHPWHFTVTFCFISTWSALYQVQPRVHTATELLELPHHQFWSQLQSRDEIASFQYLPMVEWSLISHKKHPGHCPFQKFHVNVDPCGDFHSFPMLKIWAPNLFVDSVEVVHSSSGIQPKWSFIDINTGFFIKHSDLTHSYGL